MEDVVVSPFLDWDAEAVHLWLSTLDLSRDYSTIFRDRLITGSTLVGLDREELEEMGVVDGADRLKILQQVTSMKADLVTSGKASPTKRQRHTHGSVSSALGGGLRHASNERVWTQPRENGIRVHMGGPSAERSLSNSSPTKYVNLLIQNPNSRTPDSAVVSIVDSQGTLSVDSPQGCLSAEQTSSGSRESSRASSPDKVTYRAAPRTPSSHSVTSVGSGGVELRSLNKLKSMATLRIHNVRRLSRSLNNLFPEGEDIFSLYHKSMDGDDSSDPYQPSSGRLVEILREENASLKQELESYYQKVRRLQKIEQEVEHIREAHRLMEAGTMRREGLEKALRSKLEEEVRKLKEETVCLKAEVRVARKDSGGSLPDEQKAPKREIRRRDTMITRLIKQNKDAVHVREQLEKDLQQARAQLQQQIQENRRITGGNAGTDSAGGHATEDLKTEAGISRVYSESIEKLHGVLSAMQEMSQKRELLEKKLRSQLEGEMRRLRDGLPTSLRTSRGPGGNSEMVEELRDAQIELEILNTSLAADCAKWEQKCLELVAEKQMAFEAAVIPRDVRIASLERSLAEKIDKLHDVQRQKTDYMGQLTEAKRRLSELETRLNSARSSLQEKDSVIQVMQSSLLEPDDEKGSLTPPHNGLYQSPSRNQVHDGYASGQSLPEVPPAPSSPVKPLAGNGYYTPLHGAGSRSPRTFARPSAIPLPPSTHSHAHKQHRSQSVSPIKPFIVSSGCNMRPQRAMPIVSNRFPSREPQIQNCRNGYTTHSLCSGSRYAPPPPSTSSSSPPHQIPNPPNMSHGSPQHHKPPQLPPYPSNSQTRLFQIPTNLPAEVDHPVERMPGYTASHASLSSLHMKATTGHDETRSSCQYSALPRVVKSKTPPPDYHLVSSSQRSPNIGIESAKQRHRSVDDILASRVHENNLPLPVHRQRGVSGNAPYDLFHSLVGDDVPLPRTGAFRMGFSGSSHLGGVSSGSVGYLDDHCHSRSSPSREYPCILTPS